MSTVVAILKFLGVLREGTIESSDLKGNLYLPSNESSENITEEGAERMTPQQL